MSILFAKPQTFHTFKFPSQIKAMSSMKQRTGQNFISSAKLRFVLKVSKSN